ncbi:MULTISPECIES: hypothetical protein [unclassified Sphingobium]|uniref:hypothetical protein n=1 Tax=unclassified Sphingobium TaxID=2611147 RepID=UPI001E2A1B8E|nr:MULTISPECIES: hypothetical protein [unclassified Sphingobium]GLI97830.1 hypothetical protein Sbs19_16480 [Sphingobium sp. BS19]CAH0349717.1 hypothetical protein SPH9361_00746 [Sphingobium sp. CECT 9361]
MSDIPKLIGAPIALGIAIFNWPTSHFKPTESAAARMAKIYTGVLPKTLEGGVTVQAPRSEGDILVFEVALPYAPSSSLNEAEMDRLMLNSVCVAGRGLTSFFKDGGKLRMDIRYAGMQPYAGSVMTSCPVS